MLVLGIETTGAKGSCAVMETEGRAILERRMITGRMSHLKDLTADIKDMLDSLGKAPADLGAVAVSVGPGSFTGIRIGVSTARALGQALDIPCVAVPTLELFRNIKGCAGGIAVILNARRGQVYGAVFGADGEDVLPPGPYMLNDVLDAAERLRAKAGPGMPAPVFFGDGIDAYGGMPEYADRLALFGIAEPEDRYQTADMVCLKAAEMTERGMTVGYSEVMPEYMRLAEAEQRLNDGSLRRMQEKKWRNLL
ncbi:MAG: tRNA (adenosine(37)-N6)-threonylcarbamoyltransferase complex dimerization subunit type 1 TsaB [Clostridia bacterium]|nr:tRNA (adenosine(37)-N6)-threonylcarbamoyltransferase complex dimerization subunit type 1 TsaB [Clostridia bacterium]